jgi:aspartate ammonia-lyase
MAHDQALVLACSLGNLELNQFMPLIADSLLGSLDLLCGACEALRTLCVEGIEADETRCRQTVETSTAAATSLVETLGYDAVTALLQRARAQDRPLRDVVLESGAMTSAEYDEMVSPESVTRLGSPGARPERHQGLSD